MRRLATAYPVNCDLCGSAIRSDASITPRRSTAHACVVQHISESARTAMCRNPSCALSRRVVLHIDIDGFYVGVERADQPHLQNLPVAVMQSNAGGFVALSEEAKAAGLRKGDGVGDRGRAAIAHLREMGSISLAEANAKCPGLIVLPMRVERYRQAGAAVLEVLNAWGAPVEKTSYDVVRNAVHVGDAEGFFAQHSQGLPMSARIWQGCEEDVSPDLEAGVRLAEEMRRAIRCKLGLTASVGVARSKIAARMMSPLAKPDGILLVTDTEVHFAQ
eukprot:5533892-Pleurochrysis_carterae.AAC.4